MSDLPMFKSKQDEEIAALKTELEKVKAERDELEEENLELLNAMASYPDCFPLTNLKVLAKRDLEQQIKGIESVIAGLSARLDTFCNRDSELLIESLIDDLDRYRNKLKQQAEVE